MKPMILYSLYNQIIFWKPTTIYMYYINLYSEKWQLSPPGSSFKHKRRPKVPLSIRCCLIISTHNSLNEMLWSPHKNCLVTTLEVFGHHTTAGLPTQEQGVLYWGKTVRDPIFQSTGKILWNVKPEDAFFCRYSLDRQSKIDGSGGLERKQYVPLNRWDPARSSLSPLCLCSFVV